MPVFHLAASLCDSHHAICPEIVQLRERSRLMVASLVCCREKRTLIRNDVIFKLSHSLEGHSRVFMESLFCTHQRLEWSAIERSAVFIEETAEETQCWNIRKRVHESSPVTRDYVQVAVACLNKRREQAGTIHSLPFRQHRFGILVIINCEIKCLHSAVFCWIHEIYHLYSVLADEFQHVLSCKIIRGFLKEGYHVIGAKHYFIIHISFSVFSFNIKLVQANIVNIRYQTIGLPICQ